MNKRTRELALQAKMGPALLLHHYGNVDALTNTEQDELEQIEKFAELIVQDCIEVCQGQATYDPIVLPYKPSEQFMSAIKKHFGVE